MPLGALVLSQRADASLYRDDESGYEFPKRYLQQFRALSTPGAQLIALIHEPERLADGTRGGRGGYVGWAILAAPPVSVPVPVRARPLWRVAYLGGIMPLPRTVRLEEGGHIFESWRRGIAVDKRNQALLGSSVRAVPLAEVLDVLRAADAVPDALVDWSPGATPLPERRERERVTVERLVRARGFRTQVLAAYGWRCAVTGWQATPGLASGLLDAAHLTAVERGGADDVRNGISLTPTIHRLYDAGVLGFTTTPAGLILRTGADGVRLHGQGGHLELRDGLQLLMPGDRRLWPTL